MTNRDRRWSEKASFEEAALKILRILDDGGWHKRTAEIGALSPWVADATFGKVKQYYKIKHQRVGGRDGYYEWHRCPDCADLPISARCPSVTYARDSAQ
jgi:hypothetical protein